MQIIEKITKYFDLEKPQALGLREWGEWYANTKAKRPFAYFVMETVPDKVRSAWLFVSKPIRELRYGIRVRVFDRYHVINTGLKPGYYDCDTRMIHGMFNLLVDYVEIEQAWIHVVFDKNEQRKRKHPWWSCNWTRFKAFRDPQAGIDHLKWLMTLDSPTLPAYQQNPPHAAAAREIWEIYHWWKFVRPSRPDPHDASGWTKYCSEKRSVTGSLADIFDPPDETPEERQQIRDMLDKTRALEEAYDNEDEDYLIRLIKIRSYLWT
jgi:hypothetical protein